LRTFTWVCFLKKKGGKKGSSRSVPCSSRRVVFEKGNDWIGAGGNTELDREKKKGEKKKKMKRAS